MYYRLTAGLKNNKAEPFPQVKPAPGYNFSAPDSIHKIKINQFPSFRPNLQYIKQQGISDSDFLTQLGITAHGFMVHKRMLTEFQRIALPPHAYFENYFQDPSMESNNFGWLHLVDLDTSKRINWTASEFIIKGGASQRQTIQFQSLDDLTTTIQAFVHSELISIQVIQLVSPPMYDIFTFPFSPNLYATQGCIEILNKSNATGLKIDVAHEIV